MSQAPSTQSESVENSETTSPLTDLTSFQRDLLRAVEVLGEPHGLAIKGWMESAGYDSVHHGRLYPNLDTLVDKGLVSKGSKDKRTNSYALKSRGRREIEAHRTFWEV